MKKGSLREKTLNYYLRQTFLQETQGYPWYFRPQLTPNPLTKIHKKTYKIQKCL